MKKNKGITLIALVVTIIVLLILAGVTIALLTGDNGIVKQAEYAKFATEVKSIQEQVKLKQTVSTVKYFGTIKEILNIETNYNDKLEIQDGELVYIEESISLQEKEWLEKLGIKKAEEYFSVNFDFSNEIEESYTIQIKAGEKIENMPDNPTKEGCEFIGWYYLRQSGDGENISYEEAEFDPNAIIIEDYSLYAKYKGEAVMSRCKNDFFWKYKEDIKHIIFTSDNSQIPQKFDYSWNVRENQDCSDIIAYLEIETGNLVIFSKYKIYANPNTGYYFHDFINLETIDLKNFDTSKSKTMALMFCNCTSLVNLDLSGFDTKNVTNMVYMFRDCRSLINLDLTNINTSKVENMERMFQRCYSLQKLNLESFYTPNLNKLLFMFESCNSLTELKIGNLDTTNVIDMQCMFSGCNSLKELDLSNFNTENVENMQSMFMNCKNITKLNLSNFDTKNVRDMRSMFFNCNNLKELDISNFNTEKVTSMYYMFRDCNSLVNLDLSNFITTNVTDMERMFQRCNSLEILNIKNFDMTNVTNFEYMLNSLNTNVKIKTNKNMKIWINNNFISYSENVEII